MAMRRARTGRPLVAGADRPHASQVSPRTTSPIATKAPMATSYTVTFGCVSQPVVHWQATVGGMDCRAVARTFAHVRSKVRGFLARALEIAALEAVLRMPTPPTELFVAPCEHDGFLIIENIELPLRRAPRWRKWTKLTSTTATPSPLRCSPGSKSSAQPPSKPTSPT